MESIINTPTMTMVGTSDACDTGAGFCINKECGHYKFNHQQTEQHINQKEAHAITMMLHNLRNQLTGKKLILLVDDTSLFYSMVEHWGSERLMSCVHEICYLMMEYKIQMWFEWIPTGCNKLADSLSRIDFKCFWKWVRIHSITVRPKHIKLDYYFKLQYLDNLFRDSQKT